MITEIFFFRNHAENVAGRLVLGLFKKALYEVKASLVSIYLDSPQLGIQ